MQFLNSVIGIFVRILALFAFPLFLSYCYLNSCNSTACFQHTGNAGPKRA